MADQQPGMFLDAVIQFKAPNGGWVTFDWDAVAGHITMNGKLIHNTNDIAQLHLMAKAILASQAPNLKIVEAI